MIGDLLLLFRLILYSCKLDLRPSGWVLVNNTKIFVVTEGEFVDKDQQVTIMSVDGNRVVVRSSINE